MFSVVSLFQLTAPSLFPLKIFCPIKYIRTKQYPVKKNFGKNREKKIEIQVEVNNVSA